MNFPTKANIRKESELRILQVPISYTLQVLVDSDKFRILIVLEPLVTRLSVDYVTIDVFVQNRRPTFPFQLGRHHFSFNTTKESSKASLF